MRGVDQRRDGPPRGLRRSPLRSLRRALPLAGLLAATTLCSCAGLGNYAGDRGWDLVDIVDLKGGRSMGLGAKLEATLYLGAGLGGAGLGQTYEWYGRQRVDTIPDEGVVYGNGIFLHILIVGFDVNTVHGGPPAKDSLNIFGINRVAFSDHSEPPMLDRWRFGGELLLPFVGGGLYLNLGQVVDFVLGFTTLDIAGDDGLDASGPRRGDAGESTGDAAEPDGGVTDAPASTPPADDEAPEADTPASDA